MHAKTVKFDIGQGGEVPQVNWEDRSAAIALIKHGPTKALASLLLWGSNEHWNWSDDFDEVVRYLTSGMLQRCDADDRQAPKGCSHSREGLAYLMSRMTLHFELYNPVCGICTRLRGSCCSVVSMFQLIHIVKCGKNIKTGCWLISSP